MPGDVGELRQVQRPDRADHEPGVEHSSLGAVRRAEAHAPRAVVLVPHRRGDAWCRTGSAAPGRTRRAPRRSSRGARAAGSSTRSSGRPARTSSSTGGCRRRPGRRGSGSPTRCRPGPSFFSTIVNGRPAWARRMPARMPDWPQPMTITGAAALTSAAISSPQVMARGRRRRTACPRRASGRAGRRRSRRRGRTSAPRRTLGRELDGLAPGVPVGGDGGQSRRGRPRPRSSSDSPHW